jgi:hypothetical protein
MGFTGRKSRPRAGRHTDCGRPNFSSFDRFMPPVPEELLPGELLVRFAGEAPEALMRLLAWLSPLTVCRKRPAAIELAEGR